MPLLYIFCSQEAHRETVTMMAHIHTLVDVHRQGRSDATFASFNCVTLPHRGIVSVKQRQKNLEAEMLLQIRKQQNRLDYISLLLRRLAKAENSVHDALSSGNCDVVSSRVARASREKIEVEDNLCNCYRFDTLEYPQGSDWLSLVRKAVSLSSREQLV